MVTCHRCKARGHTVAACPEPLVCSKCRQDGHTARECTQIMSRSFVTAHRANTPFRPVGEPSVGLSHSMARGLPVEMPIEEQPREATGGWGSDGSAPWVTEKEEPKVNKNKPEW